jgi:hypothetical protein
MEAKAILLRLRKKDTANGVTKDTLKHLAKTLGVSETDAIHKALAESARTHLPQYEPDDGPLTDADHRAISSAVRKAHGGVRVIESLFDDEVSEGPRRDDKKVRPSTRPR